ncbi:hypothetical protein FJT64_021553 [Amphibalanus amphitrite]|uniref:BHLH domain-containing protein n=1 Tax=Amphibalanus amphitrite TaxID=1232801 RepID=A0A6A4WHY4_AMPAM|nr:hypothetical protein FJT64_021553 [Amphibalanus amphitrite]KAF0307048.1 hypothetical protein FJT64_021553 [Amphibalanus amphitrite]
MDEEIDPQEIIPDHQDSPSRDPLGSSSSIGVDHPSMSDYLEFMKDIPKRTAEGGIDQKTGYPVMDGNGSLLSTSGDKDRMESSAVDSDGLNASAGSYSQGFAASIYRPALSHQDSQQSGLNVPRYSTRSGGAAFHQYDNWTSPFNQDGGTMTLNSSGEENKMGSPEEYARLQDGAGPSSAGEYFNGESPGFRPVTHQLGSIIGPLDGIGCMPVCPGRETHNEKERKRRYRIKNACSLLKDLVPGLSDKTDKATVLEYTVQYLIHLKKHVGRQFDKDFMEKYSPY